MKERDKLIQKPKGTRDFSPEEMEIRRLVEEKVRKICKKSGFREVKTPTFEYTDLFELKSGEEIIEDIYDFEDKSGRNIALRPEITAPVMRFYSESLRARPKPLKLYYIGNCFRYEQPQKGRYREFWQFGTEIIGGNIKKCNAESIHLACSILDEFDLDFSIEIGHLGILRGVLENGSLTLKEQNKVMSLIDKGEEKKLFDLIEKAGASDEIISAVDSLINMDKNKSKSEILDCTHNIVKEFDIAKKNFEEFVKVLEIFDGYKKDFDYIINFGISRGLDYYIGTVFEIFVSELGAQNQICGGGSYKIPPLMDKESTGFAFGFDRLVEALSEQKSLPKISPNPFIMISPVSEEFRKEALNLTLQIRRFLPADIDMTDRGIGDQLSYANSLDIPYVGIIGEKEVEEKTISLKNMVTGEQSKIEFKEIIEFLKSKYKSECGEDDIGY
ncbi:MAG: histidine--tRNA ligase [Methanonatronarchaeia archaeon]|nr:MAG: histidine--tRNA ligase [Methanonatronarchaeia archaeon]